MYIYVQINRDSALAIIYSTTSHYQQEKKNLLCVMLVLFHQQSTSSKIQVIWCSAKTPILKVLITKVNIKMFLSLQTLYLQQVHI